ncbi:hypothetical protein [Ruegeria meonggei]|uniref:hypothetical protein n=1 Tax=Ruegeria meonggei TaxID=1446476 RepID=UPI003670421F
MEEQRASANGEVLSYPRKSCTRVELQHEALIVKCLLDAATSLIGGNDSQEHLVEVMAMAQERAQKLNIALDSVSEPEMTS